MIAAARTVTEPPLRPARAEAYSGRRGLARSAFDAGVQRPYRAISAAHQPGTSPVARELPCNQVQFFKGFDVPKDVQRFDEFWIYYLRQHAKMGTRALHLIGTAIALLAIMAGILFGRSLVAILGIVLGYAVATSAHFIFEGNRPVLVHPLWSVQADLRMFWLWLRGRLGDELARAGLDRKSD